MRSEVAAQRQTIEELKALVEKLAAGQAEATDNGAVQVRPVADAARRKPIRSRLDAPGEGTVHLMNAVLVEADPAVGGGRGPGSSRRCGSRRKMLLSTAGWSGEHFFIKSPDGQFSISPYGYLDTDYRAYKGDGAPPDTFLIRRARFGFQGNYGSHFDFALLTDANATTGAIVRDAYLNVRIRPEFQFQAGQFKEPFAQETGIGATNLDFVERGFQSLLYPSTVTAYRSPGIAFHGDINGGVIQWWAGAFNGRGGVTANVTNEPDFVGQAAFLSFPQGQERLAETARFWRVDRSCALSRSFRRREFQRRSPRRRLHVLSPVADQRPDLSATRANSPTSRDHSRCAESTSRCRSNARMWDQKRPAVWDFSPFPASAPRRGTSAQLIC